MSCNLTDAEWKLMHRLWDSAPQTITQLTAALREETRWEKHTVITMLSRLEAKGAVRHEEGARAKKFYPTVKQGDAARAETESFLGKVYGGSLGLMMSAYSGKPRSGTAGSAVCWSGSSSAGGSASPA